MKRFYKDASVQAGDGGFALLLDERPVKTPGRAPLLVPSAALAEEIAAEWRAQGETIQPRAMMLTGLANAVIDRTAPDTATFAAGLARYAENDLLSYRAEGPAALVGRQEAAWNPLLTWARGRYDAPLKVTAGIVHVPQPEETLTRLGKVVAARDPFALAGLSPLVTASGSLIIALAVAEKAIDSGAGWAAATIDEAWQAEQWGEDAEAATALAARRREFEMAARFLALLG